MRGPAVWETYDASLIALQETINLLQRANPRPEYVTLLLEAKKLVVMLTRRQRA